MVFGFGLCYCCGYCCCKLFFVFLECVCVVFDLDFGCGDVFYVDVWWCVWIVFGYGGLMGWVQFDFDDFCWYCVGGYVVVYYVGVDVLFGNVGYCLCYWFFY